tara:strand:- start:12109 stop:12315 length:207 start_codon:yes stop_codon:yes gene_type:complete
MKKIKLSTKGKFGLLPSLIITIPLLISIFIIGLCLFLLAKFFDYTGIMDALDYQYKIFKRSRIKSRLI